MRKDRRRGQSALELALVMVLFVSMLSITFNAVMAFSLHQYFSYVAFMGARALQAAGSTPADQRSRAVQTLRHYIPGMDNNLESSGFVYKTGGRVLATDIVGNIVPTPGATPPESGYPTEGSSGTRGVVIRFKVPFVSLPIGPSMRGALQTLDMEVVSYLGREPNRNECLDFFRAFFSLHASGGSLHNSFGMEDTGC